MNARKIVICAVLFLTASALLLHAAAENTGKPKKELVRIGVFDSRGVAIAYAHSSRFIDELKSKKAEMEKAKAAGDKEKMQALEQAGKTAQAGLRHRKRQRIPQIYRKRHPRNRQAGRRRRNRQQMGHHIPGRGR